MLKLLYKTLLVSVLSGSLLMLDFSYKGVMVNSGWAQTTTTSSSKTGLPGIAEKETVKTEGVKDSDLMATLTMTAIGLLTSRLYSCKLTTDMMVAAAGGAAFIAGEVLATIKLKKVMKDLETEIKRDPNGNVNKEQVQALERLKKSYEEAKKTAGTKKMLQMAAAAAFAAAAVIAYTLDGSEKSMSASCIASLATAANSCAALSASLAGSQQYAAAKVVAAGGTEAGVTGTAVGANDATELVPAPSSGKMALKATKDAAESSALIAAMGECNLVSGATSTCKAGTTLELKNRGVCAAPPALVSTPAYMGGKYFAGMMTPAIQNPTLFNVIKNIFMPEARADLFSPLGIVSGAAIAFVMMTSQTIGIQIDTFLFVPMNRAIVWGVLAGLAFAASTATDNVIRKLEGNIAKIDAILNSMYNYAQGSGSDSTKTPAAADPTNPAGTTTATTRPGTTIKVGTGKYDDTDLSASGGGNLPCFTGSDSKKCPSFEDVAKNVPNYTSLDVPTQQQVADILKTANGVNGTSKISGATMDGLARLAASANALKANADKAKAKAQERLKLAKSKTNLDDVAKKFENGLNNAVKSGLSKSNSSASDMLAHLGGGRGALPDVAKGSEAEGDLKKGDPAVANIIDIGAGSVPGANAGLDGLEGAGANGLSSAELAAQTAAKTDLDSYDISTGDISNDTGASIFDLISNRYMQSGYPRLFKVKEPAPVKK